MTYTYEERRVTKRTFRTEPFKQFVKVYETIETYIDDKLESVVEDIFITSEDKLECIKGLDSIPHYVTVKGLYQDRATVMMLSKETYKELLSGYKKVYDRDVFEEYDEKTYQEDSYDLVLWNHGSYELLDLDGNYIPVAIRCSYAYEQGRITNKIYDLKELIKRLESDERVFALQENNYKPNYMGKEPLKISSIPSYNASEDETQEVVFYFVPDKEVYNEAMKMKNSFERIPYMLDKMFGLKRKID